jgi:hypothetical protein
VPESETVREVGGNERVFALGPGITACGLYEEGSTRVSEFHDFDAGAFLGGYPGPIRTRLKEPIDDARSRISQLMVAATSGTVGRLSRCDRRLHS